MILAFKPSKKKLSPLPPYNNGRPEQASMASTRGTKRKRSPSRIAFSANVVAEEVPPVGGLEDVFVETTHASEARRALGGSSATNGQVFIPNSKVGMDT